MIIAIFINKMRRNFLLFVLAILILAVNIGYAEWEIKHPMRYPRYGAMVATVNNRIYVIGGMTTHPDTAVRWVEEYNPTLDTWITKASMPTPRGLGVCGVVNGKIYVIGGLRANNIPVESVEVYDPILNQWSRKKKLPTKRYEFNGGVIGDSIYVVGGYFPSPTPGFYSDTVEVYNAVRDSWFIRSSMNVPRVEFGSAVCNNKLYAIGGYYFNYQNANEQYDPSQDTWIMKSPLPVVRNGLVCATLGNNIFAIGGQRFQPRIIFARVERYNVDTDSWSIVETLNVARVYAGAVTLNNNIYVIGGLGRNGAPSAVCEKYSQAPGIEDGAIYQPEMKNISIFPNPAKTFFAIRCPWIVDKITLYDVTGKIVKEVARTQEHRQEVRISTNEISNGIYFIQVINQSKQASPLIKLLVVK